MNDVRRPKVDRRERRRERAGRANVRPTDDVFFLGRPTLGCRFGYMKSIYHQCAISAGSLAALAAAFHRNVLTRTFPARNSGYHPIPPILPCTQAKMVESGFKYAKKTKFHLARAPSHARWRLQFAEKFKEMIRERDLFVGD